MNTLPDLSMWGYVVRAVRIGGHRAIVVAGTSDVGVLYGVFALLRQLQAQTGIMHSRALPDPSSDVSFDSLTT